MVGRSIGLLLVVAIVALTVRITFASGATRQAGDITLGAGTAVLVRNNGGVVMTLELTGVVPGHVYSAWWFVGMNPPENVGGAIGNHGGRATIAGHLSEGGILADARADEIIVRVLYHGPTIPGQIHEQMTTTSTGAPPSNCNGAPGSCAPPVAVIEFDAP